MSPNECCGDSERFELARALSSFTPSSTASTTRTTQGSSANTIKPTLTATPNIAHESHSNTQKTKVGLGVGIGIGVPLLLGLGLLVWFFQTYNRKRQDSLGKSEGSRVLKGELDGAEVSELRDTEVSVVHELECAGTAESSNSRPVELA